MILRNAPKIGLLLFAIAAVRGLTQAAPTEKAYIYSNVEYNEEGGDLLGYEIEFQLSGSQVSGVMRLYEGGCGEPISLTGKLTAGRLNLHGQSRTYGRVDISGIVGNGSIIATIRMEKATKAETVKLKSIAKPHC